VNAAWGRKVQKPVRTAQDDRFKCRWEFSRTHGSPGSGVAMEETAIDDVTPPGHGR
jgi:hypothetical protein